MQRVSLHWVLMQSCPESCKRLDQIDTRMKRSPFLHAGKSSSASTARKPRCIVLEPSRDLAEQTTNCFNDYGRFLTHPSVKASLFVGGVEPVQALRALKDGVDVVVGTPARVLDWIERGKIPTDQVWHVCIGWCGAHCCAACGVCIPLILSGRMRLQGPWVHVAMCNICLAYETCGASRRACKCFVSTASCMLHAAVQQCMRHHTCLGLLLLLMGSYAHTHTPAICDFPPSTWLLLPCLAAS